MLELEIFLLVTVIYISSLFFSSNDFLHRWAAFITSYTVCSSPIVTWVIAKLKKESTNLSHHFWYWFYYSLCVDHWKIKRYCYAKQWVQSCFFLKFKKLMVFRLGIFIIEKTDLMLPALVLALYGLCTMATKVIIFPNFALFFTLYTSLKVMGETFYWNFFRHLTFLQMYSGD